MRPVNLIPPEDRRGDQAPLRTGPLAYIVIGALVAVLAGVTVLVLTGNEIAEREDELVTLKSEDSAAAVKAKKLAAYTQFRELSEQRVATVQSLADSRFDWERVMRELTLVLPEDIWLVELTGTAAPGVSIDSASGGGSGSSLRGAAKGPALELEGCGAGQASVANFVTVLKDIDGVTRVGVQSSELADEKSGAGVSPGGEAGSGGGDDCRTRTFIAKFQIVVAFDAAPLPLDAETEAEVSSASDEAETTAASASETEESEGG
jgi:Tfp pilus assembly protein PilN